MISKEYTESIKKDVDKIVAAIISYKPKFSGITKSKEKSIHKFMYVDEINNNQYFEEVELTDEEYEFRKYTDSFRDDLRNGTPIEEVIPQALALCSEAINRRSKGGKIPYPCQLEASVAMNKDAIAEMKTGEGKTLVQILSAYLYALEATSSQDKNKWKSVHVLTANDYLAKRDNDENQSIFKLLGLSTGYAYSQERVNKDKKLKDAKKEVYKCDIVYATPSTVAFDHLDDHHAYKKEDVFLRKPLYKAIIDEADEILLDQATTPLILGPKSNDENYEDLYEWAYKFISGENGYRSKPVTCTILEKEEMDDYFGLDRLDPEHKGCFYDTVIYRDSNLVNFSDRFNEEIYTTNDIYTRDIACKYNRNEMYIAVSKCLEAKYLYNKDKEYEVIEDKENNSYRVKLVDKYTGRIKDNNTYVGGLQEAIEAKEAYRLENTSTLIKSKPTRVLGKITYPAFINLYEKGFVGMTGSSDDEEFRNLYGKETYHVALNKESKRIDEEDAIFVTKEAKYKAIISEIEKSIGRGGTLQPILVGTLNVKESNEICELLDSRGIRYTRLDAVNNSNEEEIIEHAGLPGSVTIATNMAGRGSNILIDDIALKLGGLYVISTSKNDNLRIDSQLKGRAGRQGEPGKTKSFSSLEDDLIKECYGYKLIQLVDDLEIDRNRQISNKKIIKLVYKAQQLKNGILQSIRKQTNEKENRGFIPHKNFIYEQRDIILNSNDEELKSIIKNNIMKYINDLFESNDEMEIVSKIHHVIKMDNCFVPGNLNDFKINVVDEIEKRIDIIMKKIPDYCEIMKKNILNIIDDKWLEFMDILDDNWNESVFLTYSGKDTIKEYEIVAKKKFDIKWEEIRNEIMTYAIYPTIEYGKYTVESKDNFLNKIDKAKNSGIMTPHLRNILDNMKIDYKGKILEETVEPSV